jgi:hypothetical protein
MFVTIGSAFAGPFGLEMGMSLEEVTKACGGIRPERLENDDRYLISPTKSHPDFEYYLVFVDDNKGLYCIRSISKEINTSKYGTELKSFFHEMTERLSKTYGKPEVYDKIKKDVMDFLKKDEWWLHTLQEGSRILEAVWEKGAGKVTMSKDLDYVWLYADTPKLSYDKGVLILEYGFINSDEIKKSQDDVF